MNYYYFKLAKVSARIVGYPVTASIIYAQWAHETNNFTSDLCVECHNLGGLTQANENSNPQPDGNNYYMEFISDLDFARYFGSYLKLYAENGLYECKTVEDYVHCLKVGGYFGDTEENYLKGMMRYYE